jgi:predicted short-subunit dehydrogenase-like oxidoreductase (DUF2520 family)
VTRAPVPWQVVVVGRGKVGRALAHSLRASGMPTMLVQGRSCGRAQVAGAALVVLAVPDDAIASCAHRLAEHVSTGTAVVHCAGARGIDALDGCSARGIAVAVMHPMVSFADAKRPPSLEGTSFVVHGDAAAVRAVKRMAKELGARVVIAAVHGPAYHAAAVLVANASAALASAAVNLLGRLGMGRRDAQGAVAGLLHTVAENIERVGVPNALTGPVARGDAPTVRKHRAALAQMDPRALDAYDRVAPVILDTAVEAGLPPGHAGKVRTALTAKP